MINFRFSMTDASLPAAARAAADTLDQVETGATVRVTKIFETNPHLYRKLHAMGVVCGNALKVIGRAPLGDPINISTLGYTLSLRASEAREIGVEAFGE